MFLSAIRSMLSVPRAAQTEGGDWDLVDARTGKLLTSGTQTDSGIPVTAETALGYHAWFRAIHLIASKAARVPKYVYRYSKDGRGKVLIENHPASRVINLQANEEQTAFQFWLQMTGHVASRGNGYAYIYRDISTGPATELIPLDPDKTHPVRKDGKLWYVSYPFGYDSSKGPYRFLASDMLHFKGWGFDGLIGYPIWEVAKNEIGLAKGERKLVSSRFKNSGRPSMILETDKNLPPRTKDRIRDDWERMHTGLDNTGKTAVLDHGLKARPIAMDAQELGQDSAAAMSLIAISNYTGVPVTKLGGGKPYANQEQEDRAFVNDGLGFYLDLEDDEITAKLITDKDRTAGVHARSDREVLLDSDLQTKFGVLRIATAGKPFMTQNEARERIDMPPAAEETADELGMPLNMGQGGFQNENSDPAEPKQAGRPGKDNQAARKNVQPEHSAIVQAARDQVSHLVTRLVKRVGNEATAAATGGASKYMLFLRDVKANHLHVFVSELSATSRLVDAIQGDGHKREIAQWLYESVVKEYEQLAETGAASIASRAANVLEGQKLRMPQKAIDIFLPLE